MLNWLFRRHSQHATIVPPFQHGESLTLDWDEDCEGWTSALPELGRGAKIYIGPRAGVEHPQSASCTLVVQARERILSLNDAALSYLVRESGAFVEDTYKHSLSSASFTPTGLEIFEHEGTLGEYALTYDPAFDPGAIWRVRFRQQQPAEWGFDS